MGVEKMKRSKHRVPRIVACCLAAVMSFTSAASYIEAKAYSPYAKGIKAVKITASTFPDPIFRSYVSSAFDSDKNGTLDPDEILYARNIQCDNMGIKSLKGIEHLVELRGVYASFNELRELDLSKNPQITGVWVSNNKFKKLDFSKNAKTLEWVYCFDNPTLTVLDLSGCKKLSYLECSECNLKKLDVSKFPELEHLICASCGLKELDLSHNKKLTHLDAFNNPDNGRDYPLNNRLTKLDLSNNKKMKRLDIWANYNLKFVNVSMCPDLQYFNCAMIGADRVDVSKNPELIKLNCAYNKKIKTLDLSHNPKLCYLDCSDNKLTGLDLSHNPKLYFLQAFINSFTKLDIGYNPLLIKARKEGKKEAVYNIAHAWIIDFGIDDSTSGDQIYEVCYDDKVKLSMTPKTTPPTKAVVKLPAGVPKSQLLKREEVVQALYDMAGRPSVVGLKTRFKDVKSGCWYTDAMLWGQKYNICVGTPDISSDKFGIGEWVTRQDAALMMMRFAEYMGLQRAIDFGRSDEFKDYNEIDYYAWEAVCWAATWNIMLGKGKQGAPKSERYILPHTAATRTDFREMTERMFDANKTGRRLSGKDRYETAAAISGATYPKADTVILAYSMKYADALAGVGLAYKLNAPILLTNTHKIDRATLYEMKRLGATKVKILGGKNSISQKAVQDLIDHGIKKENIERISGDSRFGTATAIAGKLTSSPKNVFFVYGYNYADALSVSTVAAIKGAPIIYLPKDGKLDADTAKYLRSIKGKVRNAYVIGGESVISKEMMNAAVKACGLSKAARVYGDNRFETCVAVNRKFGSTLSSKTVCVATGANFPDALAGGVFAAKNKAPLFLASGSLSSKQYAYLKDKGAENICVFGGKTVVPESLVKSIVKAGIQ